MRLVQADLNDPTITPYVGRPGGTVDYNDAVNVVWHHHKGVQRHAGKMCRNLEPTRLEDTPKIIYRHFASADLTE